MFRRFVVAIALACAAVPITACSDDTAPTTTPSTTSTPTVTTRPTNGGNVDDIDGVGRRIDAVVGADLSFEARVRPDALGPGGSLASAFKVGSRIVVWMRLADEPAGVETSAQFGYAEVRAVDGDGATFAVSGRVPTTLWRREQRAMPLTAVATGPGEYEVALQNLIAQRVTVRAGPPPPASTTTAPAPVSAASQVLGVADLAGVAFGVDEAAAMSRLTARFGRPWFDEEHTGACGTERLVGWGTLLVAHRDLASGGEGPRVFASYVYSAPRALVVEGPTDLRTASGLAPGASLAELQAREPRVVFVTDQVGYAATTWYASPGSRLGGRIDDDVSAADVAVIEIASSAPTSGAATYPGC